MPFCISWIFNNTSNNKHEFLGLAFCGGGEHEIRAPWAWAQEEPGCLLLVMHGEDALLLGSHAPASLPPPSPSLGCDSLGLGALRISNLFGLPERCVPFVRILYECARPTLTKYCWRRQQPCTVLQFWSLEVQDLGASRVGAC